MGTFDRETGGADENGVNEGAPYKYYDNLLINHARNDNAIEGRIKYLAGEPRYWRLRSPSSAYSWYARAIGLSGNVGSLYNANSALGASPACCII